MNKNDLINTVIDAQNGDRSAFETLYNEYYDKLYFFVLKTVGRKDAAEDITQETFLRSMESIGSLEKPETYTTWLHSIAYNKCRDMFRAENRNAYFETEEEQQDAFESMSLNEPIMVPEDYATNKDTANKLKAMIDSLKPDMKSAVILYYYDDMSISEVARILKMNDNAVKQKLFQARKKLKAQIDMMKKKGVVFSAVPMGSLLRTTVSPKKAAAARVTSGAAVSGGLAGGKIAAAAAAIVIAVGVPIALHAMGNDKNDITGDNRVVESRADTGISFADSSDNSVREEISSTAETVSSKADDTESETSRPDREVKSSSAAEKKSSDETSSVKEISLGTPGGGSTSTAADSSAADTVNSNDTSSHVQQDTSSKADDSSKPEQTETQPVEMSVDKLLDTSVEDLLKLSNNEFEPIAAANSQGMAYGYKCKAFPEYVFITDIVVEMDQTEVSSDREFIHYMTDGTPSKVTLGDSILQINVYENGDIGNGITIGMSYEEIKALNGGTLDVFALNTSMGLCSRVNIGGREWLINYDLTDEERQRVFDKMAEMSPTGELMAVDDPVYIDLADLGLDPASHCAAYQVTDFVQYGGTGTEVISGSYPDQ